MAVIAASEAALQRAAAVLCDGGLVAFPTETVYGLGGDATSDRAVASIFAAKGRPSFNPLIVHVPSVAAAETFALLTDAARRLSDAFWPGPLTLVMRRTAGGRISQLATAGLDTVAVRMPSEPTARRLLEITGRPLAAPSANRSGRVSPTLARHVEADLGERVDLIIDGGATQHGLESTVVDVSGDEAVLLRPGAVPREAIEAVLGSALLDADASASKPTSPGQLASHYAPVARVRLDATTVEPGEALLAFGPNVPVTAGPMINLSAGGDVVEAAANLYTALRALDNESMATIAVMPIPHDGVGEAINDRLRRAAAPRPR